MVWSRAPSDLLQPSVRNSSIKQKFYENKMNRSRRGLYISLQLDLVNMMQVFQRICSSPAAPAFYSGSVVRCKLWGMSPRSAEEKLSDQLSVTKQSAEI